MLNQTNHSTPTWGLTCIMEKQQRTHFVGVKFTHDERQRLEQLSKYSGKPLSKVIRDLIQKGLEA